MSNLPRPDRHERLRRGDDFFEVLPQKPINIYSIYTCRHFELPANYTNHHTLETHDEYELIFVESGLFLDTSEEKPITMRAGDAVIYGPDYPHCNHCDGVHSASIFISTFMCDGELMKKHFPNNTKTFIRFTSEQRKILASAFSAGVKAYDINGHSCSVKSNAPYTDRQIYMNYLEILMLDIINSMQSEVQKEKIFFAHHDRCSRITQRIIEYLESKVYESVTIEDICSSLGYSRGHVCNHFKKDTGKTVNNYFQLLKIEEAKRLILETNLDFLQISEMLGYSNPQYFNKVFRQYTGYTPGFFRKTIFKGSIQSTD